MQNQIRHYTLVQNGSGSKTTNESELNIRPSMSACIEPNKLTKLALHDENKPHSESEEILFCTDLAQVVSNC